MVKIEIEISAIAGGLFVGFGGWCRLLPDDENFQEGNRTV
jgi:hypothetical protein